MSGGGQGEADARAAAELNQQLFRQYSQVGLPALGGALQYTRGALAQGGLPGYVERAYRQANVGALEENVSQLGALRSQIASRAGSVGAGGQYLSAIGATAGSAGDSLTRELAGVRTSRAVAGIEQRNKLLGILAGGAATGTSLSAGFGQLGNQAISLNRQPDPTFGLITGGLAAGTGLYAQLAQAQPRSNLGTLPIGQSYASYVNNQQPLPAGA